ncbi:MAG: hypothetical protein RG740_07700, partial [Acholeplasmataceae bacterium]|nr:hypothetical protein [Acholeplasmataceae bacterium]
TDGVVSDVSADFVTVTIDLSAYVTNLGGLQVIGFHMNEGGVIIDNLVLSQDVYGYQLSLFNDSPVE